MSISVLFFDLGETLVTSPGVWLPGAKDLLESLKQKGVRLGIISNTHGLLNRQAILNLLPADFSLASFEAQLVLFSSEVGVEKPKRQIFEKAVAAANVVAKTCLYCSEDPVETLVAQQVGMRALRIVTGSTDLLKLESYVSSYQSNI